MICRKFICRPVRVSLSFAVVSPWHSGTVLDCTWPDVRELDVHESDCALGTGT